MNKTLTIVAATAALLAGCGIAKGKEDAGPTTERDFQVGNFNQIELAGGYDVNVRTGSAPSVHAKGGQNVLDKLEIKVVNGVLQIAAT
jgi:Putative auto-transporter adhesin, head GIN domain